MSKYQRCPFHKLLFLSANCTIKMSVLYSGLCRIELTINSFKINQYQTRITGGQIKNSKDLRKQVNN